MIQDQFIKTRDSVLNKVTGVNPHLILNASRINQPNYSGRDVAAEVKMAVEQFKITAMDENGFQVNYAELRESRAYIEFKEYCSPRLRTFDPTRLKTDQERLAFWINLYNALVLDGILHFQVQSSVTETRLGILSFFRKTAYNVGSQRLNLDNIEHGILRANRGFPYLPGAHFTSSDPRLEWAIRRFDNRIHFALNCASRSCPPIRVYNPEQINQQLDIASRNFVETTTSVDRRSSKLTISAIFKWYQGDFDGKEGVVDFIVEHLPDDERCGWIVNNRDKLRLVFEPYDWGLNTYTG